MTESTADPLPDTMIVPIMLSGQPLSGLLRELNVLLESRLSKRPLSAGNTTLTELRLDGDGWPTTDGNKQPHYYHVAIHISAV